MCDFTYGFDAKLVPLCQSNLLMCKIFFLILLGIVAIGAMVVGLWFIYIFTTLSHEFLLYVISLLAFIFAFTLLYFIVHVINYRILNCREVDIMKVIDTAEKIVGNGNRYREIFHNFIMKHSVD